MRSWLIINLVVVPLAMAATDPATNGPYAWAQQVVNIPGTQGANLSTDLYYPGVTGVVDPLAAPCPVIVLGHGFFQSKARHVNQGRHLASRGFLVLIPDFNGGSDHARNAEDIRRCLDWIIARNAEPSSFLAGNVNTEAIGVSGHSAGGLSAILASAADSRIRAVSVMDPVDNDGQGVTALPSVAVPIAMTWSEPSSCNANGSAEVLYAAAKGVRRGIKMVGANHTDPQDPAGILSIITCGSANAARQTLYRRYMAGWFERYLRQDATYDPYVYNYPGGQLATDFGQALITYHAVAPLILKATVEEGETNVEVTGPAGQPYVVIVSTNGAAWATTETNQTGSVPTPVKTVPPEDRVLLRTQSLP